MYERFTDRARKVMQLADEEARRFSHEYVGTEHILLGLVKEGSGTASWVLNNLDIELRKIHIEVEKILQRGPEAVTQGRLPQTPRAKKVIEYAMDESRNLGHSHVGTEHLLLGLIREKEGVAAQVLMNLGLKVEDLREEILNIPVVDEESIKQAFADMSGLNLDRKPVRKISIDQLYGSDYSPAVPQNSWVQPECSPTRSTASEYERHQIESVFHSQPGGIQRGLGFVLLPHKPEFQAIYEEAISPAFRANHLEPLKADDIYRPGSILSQVWSQIRTAEVLVADVSGLNPNVIFELGLCHGMHRCPILLVRDPAELPFNLRSLRYIVYSNDITGIKRLREQLKRSIEEFIAATRPADEIPNGDSVHE